jgi:hypothetical protein
MCVSNELLLLLLLVVVVVVVVVVVFSLWAGLAGTRAQSGDRYDSGTLHSGQVLRGSLPLLSPALYVPTFAARCLHLPTKRALLVAKGGTGREWCPVILPK